MKVYTVQNSKTLVLVLFILFSLQKGFTQDENFWSNVRFGGNLGLGFTNETFSVVVAPSAIYDFNQWFSAGVGLSFGYTSFDDKDFDDKRTSINYGGSIITLFNPIRELQFSAEFEEMGVSRDIEIGNQSFSDNYWYPALFLGAGYRAGFVSFGLRYDVLYDSDKSIYGSAYAPFVRVFF
ncbi:alpha-ketoglutarate decarboxylase [Aquimarina sp. 2201CG5-10]|uniref:alpha-ketoglutarate decarboxylase n=1 Tax=Aquimarina callyspongiae TaxID=3098150 RepID=UPI002AB3FC9F|nr:alpha-ketoglutarate decarboxylase [Aquimarina sp. 2201CG5-10]MDY8136844.1 alpha-ketoglutarate decarboxylase [Aquimarina sp. 2201CG5-10]